MMHLKDDDLGENFVLKLSLKTLIFFFREMIVKSVLFFKKAHLALRQNNLTARSVSTR